MAKKKSESATISFDLPAELKDALETLAESSKKDVSEILVKLVEKGTKATPPQITFRCTAEQKESIEILASASFTDVTKIMVRLVDEFIAANTERISLFKAQAAVPLNMPMFAEPTPPKKSARTAKKKKNPAQVADSPTVDDVKVGGGIENP
ncbi:MAG: hypothetical protein IKN27_04830 [Selenomonadaceae bacterium]|nr:hypothetical protein [Selenomonadaceae bacterium]